MPAFTGLQELQTLYGFLNSKLEMAFYSSGSPDLMRLQQMIGVLLTF